MPAALALAELLAAGSTIAVALLDAEGRTIGTANLGAISAALGRPVDAIVANPASLVREQDIDDIVKSYLHVSRTPGAQTTVAFWARNAEDVMVRIEAVATNQLADELGAIVVRLEASAGVGEELTFEELSFADDPELSPMLDSRRFSNLLQHVIDAKRKKIWDAPPYARSVFRDRRYNFSLILVYLDHDDLIAGGYGPGLLDQVSEQVVGRIGLTLRGRDAIAYMGSGRLGILLDGVGDVDHARRVTDQLVDVLEKPVEIGGSTISLSPVIGIATSERRYDHAEELMRDAAAAVGHAHRSGTGKRRRRAAFHTAIRVADQQRLTLVADLRTAISQRQFVVYYQPLVELATGELSGFEALVRWQAPGRGLVFPGDFIPVAEETGMIRELGDWVLSDACTRAARWNASTTTTRQLDIAVNVAAAQMMEADLPQTVHKVLARTGLDPRRLTLELTETTVLENMAAVKATLEKLRELGVRLALDDFGTGYSSLSCLHELPFDKIKIDRSFLSGSAIQHQAVVATIVQLVHLLGREVVIEGVETVEQRTTMAEMGCDLAQGYLFSKPVDAGAAEAIIARVPWETARRPSAV